MNPRRANPRRAEEGRFAGDLEWSRLSERSFARDWNSDADAIYDDLA